MREGGSKSDFLSLSLSLYATCTLSSLLALSHFIDPNYGKLTQYQTLGTIGTIDLDLEREGEVKCKLVACRIKCFSTDTPPIARHRFLSHALSQFDEPLGGDFLHRQSYVGKLVENVVEVFHRKRVEIADGDRLDRRRASTATE